MINPVYVLPHWLWPVVRSAPAVNQLQQKYPETTRNDHKSTTFIHFLVFLLHQILWISHTILGHQFISLEFMPFLATWHCPRCAPVLPGLGMAGADLCAVISRPCPGEFPPVGRVGAPVSSSLGPKSSSAFGPSCAARARLGQAAGYLER